MRVRYDARILWALVPVAVFLIAGCTTTKPILGIATAGYVDSRIATANDENKKSIAQMEDDLKALQSDVAKFKDQTEQINAILDDLAKAKSTTAELQQLASTVKDKIDSLPKETLLQLADLIRSSLSENESAPADANTPAASNEPAPAASTPAAGGGK